ncbi:Phosphatidylinositol 3,4,5-trisphosphate 5-phosphatase 1 [Gracilariopsis chorda]|uniref:Phosphatidylinositol 3,4,5-trisphosphate 5-phosphatase 1 n=1 Tax=Gracilariopsis chorda TaxID=448386 RepID=A0A2V3IVF6_9FLOR|nr:Phosphatidylinositol 3,4,5-trisphosphate 5-phosphatase 1 [Gracilariopsis chorda]|eukprot:PXF46112.1 Phosphatidylinositol 3,4,5-trisphosphate 5-phosphatase 1 [Gracilariopsis chorda]
MGTRLKLRVCTWNVGNAQPPSDLKRWLGADEDFDIIAVGAQEANFGPEKTQSPTSVLSADSPDQKSQRVSGTLTRQTSQSVPSIPSRTGRFNRIAKVLRVAKETLREGSGKKTRIKALSADSEDQCWPECGTHDNGDKRSSLREKGIPVSSSSFPLRKPTELQTSFFAKGASDDVPSLSFSQFTSPTSFGKLDESLLVRSRQSSRCSQVEPCSGPKIVQFDSSDIEPDSSDESQTEEDADIIDFDECMSSKQNAAKSGKLRKQVTAFLRTDDDGGQTGEKKFSRVVEKNMPKTFHLIAKHHLMEIKLLVFVHERHRSRVVKTQTVAEATGIGNMVGNKGAVAVKLTLDDTTFCFVSSHLAAHEGAKFLVQRNEDVIEIMRNIERNKNHGLAVMHQFHHVFWMGDLNYRLDLKHLLPVAITWSHEEKLAYVTELIAKKRFLDLSSFDELRREMESNTVFGGFTEGKLGFAPTFKVVRGQQKVDYQLSRVPGYCDRILWHSLPMHRNHVRLREYEAIPEIDTSDHKPVYASFDLVIPKPTRFFALPAPSGAIKCTVDFILIQVKGLYEKRYDAGESDIQYEVLEDGALAVSPHSGSPSRVEGNAKGTAAHTRRPVSAFFHGNGVFIREKAYKVDVPLRNGQREALYNELPTIPLRPVQSLSELGYKYITLAFSRNTSKQGSSCVLPLSRMIERPGHHRINMELDLTKYGTAVAKVRVVAELVPSMAGWVDIKNCPAKLRLKKDQAALE